MSSIVQIKRSFTKAVSPAEAGAKEGELAVSAAGTGTPKLWFFGGDTSSGTAPANRGWLQLNPDPSISTVRWNIAGTASPSADANDKAVNAAAFTITAGQIVIAVHNGTAYAFTGGAGTWGDPTLTTTPAPTATTAGQFVSLGSSASDPEYYDWSARTEANLGAAYTAWNTGAGTPDFGSNVVLVKWKDGFTYLLTDTSAPGTVGNYQKTFDAGMAVFDWTARDEATVAAAYTAWNAATPATNVFTAPINVIRFGAPAATYLVTDPANPTSPASYQVIVSGADAALHFKGTVDATVAYALTPTTVGEFWNVTKSGAADASWAAVGVTGTVNAGDHLVWDGNSFHVTPSTTALNVYLELSGGTMTDTAVQTFAVPSGAAPANPTVRLDGGDAKKSALDNWTIDAGTF